MKKIFVVLFVCIALSSCSSKPEHIKEGYAITIEGDTVHFYGGTLTYPFLGKRDIRNVTVRADYK